jgi:hypothetical protein
MQMRPDQIRAKSAAAPRRRWPAFAALAGLVAIVTAAGWSIYGAAMPSQPSPKTLPKTSSNTSPTANREFSTVVIVSTPNKDTCHQYKLDGVTGALKTELPDSCINGEDRGRGAGGRLEAISRGFRDK